RRERPGVALGATRRTPGYGSPGTRIKGRLIGIGQRSRKAVFLGSRCPARGHRINGGPVGHFQHERERPVTRAVSLGGAPRDRRRQRPPRPHCLIPCHPVSPVALPGRAEGCCCYTFYYSSRDAKGPLPAGKGPWPAEISSGGGI